MTALVRFDGRTAEGQAVGAAVVEHGYAIVENLLDADGAARLNDELAPHIDAVQLDGTPFLEALTKRVSGMLSKSAMVCAMTIHPLLLAVADHVMLPWCVRYQFTFGEVMHLLPGEKPQELHRDGDMYPFRHPTPPLIMGMMWVVSDLTIENGATCFVPGSHLWDDTHQPLPEEICAAEMSAGSVLMYIGATVYGGGANRSNAARCGVAMHYTHACLRQEENQYNGLSA